MLARRDAEAREQLGRVGLGGVAVLLGDDALELAQPMAVLVGDVRAARGAASFSVHRRPQPLVAHAARRRARAVLVAELVLPQDRRLLGRETRAGVGLEVAGEDLHERRLAGAVGAGEAVAACRAVKLTVTSSKRFLAP